MMYGLETAAMTKKQERQQEVVETRMVRFSFGMTRTDNIRNEHIRGMLKEDKKKKMFVQKADRQD